MTTATMAISPHQINETDRSEVQLSDHARATLIRLAIKDDPFWTKVDARHEAAVEELLAEGYVEVITINGRQHVGVRDKAGRYLNQWAPRIRSGEDTESRHWARYRNQARKVGLIK